MLIVCPSCASTYSLTPEQLGAGRKLRCAACRHEWYATPPAEEAAPADASDPAGMSIDAQAFSSAAEPPPVAEPAAPASRKGRAKSSKPRVPLRERLAPLLSRFHLPRRFSPAHAAAAAILLVVAVAVVQRKAVVRLMPQTAKIYAAIGLPVNLRGLEFRSVRSSVVNDADQRILVVEGEVRAIAPGTTEVPRLQLSVRGADGQDLYSWTADAPRATLDSGDSVPFRARLVAPPPEGHDVLVRFVERDARVATH
ncbi:DUF3426 domain-containing protein [Alsobacter sp. R-9]